MIGLVCIGSSLPTWGQYPAQCDTRKECIGRAVSLTVNSGRNAHFIELGGQVTQPRQTALTVEMWVLLERQSGKRQYLGGLWGPNQDYNDQWVLYVDENDQLTFEVNPEATNLKSTDNTILRTPASSLYGVWSHITAVFDGASASVKLFIDGQLAAGPLTNPAYPVTYLRPMDRADLPTLIGSCNILADDANLYRTMRGMIDEVRIWNRALTDAEILCQRNLSLNGNEAGLRVYLRCNEPVNNVVQTCDATGNNHHGLLRSGASNQTSTRVLPRTVVVSPATLTDEILCDSTRTWVFTITDTSVCGSSVSIRSRGPEAANFTVTPRNLTLVQGRIDTVRVTFTGTLVGSFLDTLQVSPTNRCGYTTFVKLNVTRTTELSVSRNTIVFDTLLVGCKDKTFIDSTITICNTTDRLGAPRTVTISGLNTREPLSYRAINVSFPLVLLPGQCTTITVRSFVRDTTADYTDSLRIVSDDQCQSGPAIIAIRGRTQEVISIKNPGGTARLDTMKFSSTCPGQLSNAIYYVWQNLTLAPIAVDTIIVPPDFTHYRIGFPFTLLPATGYNSIAVRFRPRNPGVVFDSIIIRTSANGCIIERKIYVTGRGLDNRVEWEIAGPIDAGTVVVGQQRVVNVIARNRSNIDVLNVSLYVETGEAFELLGARGASIPPNGSVSIPVTFRPTDSLRYNDRLCLFETRCYTVDCIDLTGKGILETFRYSPLVMETENAVACGSKLDTVCIVNISGSTQTLTNLTFVNPTGKYRLIDPVSVPSTLTINNGDSVCFILEYIPNDVTGDRADRAYLRYKNSGEDWELQMIGTSATPKIFVTQFTTYGIVEVGDTRRQNLTVENTSSLAITIDSLTIGAGFTILSTSRALPTVLQPRDSLSVEVEFRPTATQTYNAQLTAYSSDPCVIKGTGDLTGRGIIMELESALSLVNFGYVRPCECAERTIELLNGSLVFDMNVDSLWIDSTGVPGGRPQFFSWRSKYSPTGVVPYTIPPGERDTVTIVFCPNTPADSTTTAVQALLHVKASGSQWSKELETFIIGKRALTFAPYPKLVQFPAGVVDVLSPVPRFVDVAIPGYAVNPSQDTVVIDSITFEPDDRVFFVMAPTVFPFTLLPGQKTQIELRQRPRAPRNYEARMVIHYSKPCPGFDTTVLVKGAGFAQPRGLTFAYDLVRADPDTFGMVSCDTLDVPVWSSITIDASVVDVFLRIDFDSTQLRLLGISSPLLSNSCTSTTGGITYIPAVNLAPSPYGGIAVVLKNFCGIDSLSPFMMMHFVTANNNRADSRLTIDSINFDTEDVILYKLIATGDKGTVLAYKSEITIMQPTAYDSVRILDCLERTIVVYNTGDVANTLDSLLELPVYTSIVATTPALGDSVQPGDSAVVTLRFCPGSERFIDTNVVAVSSGPCDTRDTTVVTGYGYAPELDVAVGAMEVNFVLDTLGGTIGDTIEIPVMLDKDVSASYNGITYWLNGLSVNLNVTYNARSLKFLQATALAKPDDMTVTSTLGTVTITGTDIDSLSGGELARLQFLVTVPEFQQTDIAASISGFVSDSLQFLDIVPAGNTTPFVTGGKCDITVVKFSTVGTPKIEIHPNPTSNDATITFRMRERVPVDLHLVNAQGIDVRSLLDATQIFNGGEYAVRFNTMDLPAGVYFVRITAGVFSDTVPFVVVK
jgi:hypothetical protein